MFKSRTYEAELRSICRRELDGVRAPKPFDIEEFCKRLAAKRGRPLHLHPQQELGGSDGLCGVWFSFDNSDHLIHFTGVSQAHREQIIRHELAHMLLNHTTHGDTSGLLALLPEDIDPAEIRHVFGRAGYETPQERDAELVATFLDELIEELPADSPEDSKQQVADRLDDVLTHPRRGKWQAQ